MRKGAANEIQFAAPFLYIEEEIPLIVGIKIMSCFLLYCSNFIAMQQGVNVRIADF